MNFFYNIFVKVLLRFWWGFLGVRDLGFLVGLGVKFFYYFIDIDLLKLIVLG